MRFKSKRRHKYGAIATTVDGIRFASKKEAQRYGFLKSLARADRLRPGTPAKVSLCRQW